MIPPEANADFVCAMEDVLEVYQRPYDPQRPVVCVDEAMKQLVKETRHIIPAAPGRPERVDYEYERNQWLNVLNAWFVFRRRRFDEPIKSNHAVRAQRNLESVYDLRTSGGTSPSEGDGPSNQN